MFSNNERLLYMTSSVDKDDDTEWKQQQQVAHIQYIFRELLSTISFLSCFLICFLIWRHVKQVGKFTTYEKLIGLMAAFQGLDHVSYFLNIDPIDERFKYDDESVTAQYRALNFTHRFFTIMALGAVSLLGFCITSIVVLKRSVKAEKIIIPWMVLYLMAGIAMSTGELCFKIYNEADYGTQKWKIQFENITLTFTVFFLINNFFQFACFFISSSMVGMKCCLNGALVAGRSSQSLAVMEVVRRFALYPLVFSIAKAPYWYYHLNPRYAANGDDYTWEDQDTAFDYLYYIMPESLGFWLLLVFLRTKLDSVKHLKTNFLIAYNAVRSFLALSLVHLPTFDHAATATAAATEVHLQDDETLVNCATIQPRELHDVYAVQIHPEPSIIENPLRESWAIDRISTMEMQNIEGVEFASKI